MSNSLIFREIIRQAAGALNDKLRTARLALTDVTAVQLMAEEATDGSPHPPDMRTISNLSQAAFEVDNYCRITEILHRRLSKFDRKSWREPYKALILLEHLLTHGPASAAEEFQSDREFIEQMDSFQYVDERGFNWGLAVRKKIARVLKLLERDQVLREERERARSISRGIEGFGNFSFSGPDHKEEESTSIFPRSNSQPKTYIQNMASDHRKEKKTSNTTDDAGNESTVGHAGGMLESDHPFNNFEHQNTESLLLLGRS